MLEIVKIIVDLLKDGIDFSKLSKEKKKTKIGVNLFSVYTNLNQILITGYGIVKSLENYVERMERHLTKHDDKYALDVGRNCIEYKLIEQRVNIARFGIAVQDILPELDILSGNFVRKIVPLITGKFNALGYLLGILGEKKMPIFSFTMTEFMDMVESNEKQTQKYSAENIRDNSFRIDQVRIDQECQYNFYQKLDKSTVISLEKQWSEDVYLQIKEYLSVRNPRKVLEEIENVLETLRESIEKNFSVSDIIVEVGGGKNKRGYNGEIFW
ncbi:MAG: hypothetical protein FWE95_05110 [Planctomycetaceae bacterium]|nr:hypothetical protein [Planctomycetaceae bacterium]